MKVLAIKGSPRKNGNSSVLLNGVLEGVEEAGGEISLIFLGEQRIQPCIGCGSCAATGNCVLLDDMQAIYPRIIEADRIILASPIYFYGLTAQAKAFVDRCQALWSRQRLGGQEVKPEGYVKKRNAGSGCRKPWEEGLRRGDSHRSLCL